MALSEQDKKEIELTIIKTLNNKLSAFHDHISSIERKADRANTRMTFLWGYLVGSGIITVGAFTTLFTGGG